MKIKIKNSDILVRTMALIFVLFVLAWYGTVRKTISIWHENIVMKEQAGELKNAPEQIDVLKKKKQLLEQRIGASRSITRQENIFDEITNYCINRGLKIRRFPAVHSIKTDQYQVDTYIIELEGTFHNQLQFINELEHKNYQGTVSSISFNLKRDLLTGQGSLIVTVCLQAYKSLKV